jgi:mono/diheme cytochrome c family protein
LTHAITARPEPFDTPLILSLSKDERSAQDVRVEGRAPTLMVRAHHERVFRRQLNCWQYGTMCGEMRTIICLAVSGLFASAVAALAIAERPQPPARNDRDSARTIWSGVYTAAQAKRGEMTAAKMCTPCHGPDLAGGQDGPGLVGPDVLPAWSRVTLGELFERIKTTMPADAPRSLSALETADVLAYVLSVNKCPAGNEDLSAYQDALSHIRIAREPVSRN